MFEHNVNPLVTVAMVTYNSEKFVEIAIQSVLKQTYKNFELIISDDCSSDKTWEIIQSFKDSRIIATRNEKNIGEYPNRNKCIDLAKGEYFIFVDGDDIIYSHALDNYLFYAKSFIDCPLIIEKWYYNHIIFPVKLNSEEIFLREFYHEGLLNSSFCSNFFRLSELKQLGGLSTKYRTGDTMIRYLFAINYPVLFITGWNSWPRETPGQASSKIKGLVGLFESIEILTELFKNEKFLLNNQIKIDVFNRFERALSRYLIKSLLKLNLRDAKKIIASQNGKFSFMTKFFFKTNKRKYFTYSFSTSEPLFDNSYYL